MGRLYEALSKKTTCSAVGTIHIVAQGFNPGNRRYDPYCSAGF